MRIISSDLKKNQKLYYIVQYRRYIRVMYLYRIEEPGLIYI